MNERYRRFSTYLKEKYGQRVHKISVDAGFSCPNRDGTKDTSGCIYCNNEAFSFQARRKDVIPLETQIEQGIIAAQKRFKANKYILYFQAYTNTNAPIDILKETYDIIKKYKDFVAISIATRPDCINEEILELIHSYSKHYDVWIEYGAQSIHNKTLESINRGHLYEDFLKAFELTKKYNIKICAHIILGLPGETEEMMLDTAKEFARLQIDGIKIHPLHIVKGTSLETTYRNSQYTPLQYDTYLAILTNFITYLHPKTIIQRVSAYCPPDLLIAPDWVGKRINIEKDLEEKLTQKKYYQGIFFNNN